IITLILFSVALATIPFTYGIVIAIVGEKAEVLLDKESRCSKCGRIKK
ncbi:unnamed protein product, partial [marine sediment metagenome]